jgi:hypothetical protein
MSSEGRRYVAGQRSLVFWTVLIVLSLFVIYEAKTPELLATWGACVIALFVALTAIRFSTFSSKRNDLLTKGSWLREYDYKQQHKKILQMLVIFIIAFSPLALASVLPPAAWLGSVVGFIDGWIVHLLAFNLYLKRWEHSNHGTLYKTEIWGKTRVMQAGITFVRDEERHGR